MPLLRRSRTYLEGVTYALREHAKEHGAQWDDARKCWYILGEVPEMLADLVRPLASTVAGGAGEAGPVNQALERLGEAVRGRRAADPPMLRRPPADDAQADFFVPALYDVAGKEMPLDHGCRGVPAVQEG